MKRVHILLIVLSVLIIILVIYRIDRGEEDQEILSSSESNWLVEKYGPKIYSEHDEELIIRDFFQDRRNGFFVDVGASHYKIHSTTYYLERHLGWGGIAIDAIAEYEDGYLLNRKRTRFHSFFVGDKSDEEIDFYIITKDKRKSSSSMNVAKKHKSVEKVKIPTIALNNLLEREGVSKIDFLSMDIELSEPPALRGFDINRYKPLLVCIEMHEPVRKQILGYFLKNNYEVIDKYMGLDPRNWYFTPKI